MSCSTNIEKVKIGMCFGGYCPMHRGHLDAIMKAKKENDVCVVVVCGYDNEPRAKAIGLDLNKRFQLVKEFFRNDEQIVVIKINDTELGLDESMCLDNWKVWYSEVKRNIESPDFKDGKFCLYDYDMTVYVGEEFYKEQLIKAFDLNVEFVPKNISISGTEIRKNPLEYWQYIVPTYRPYLSKNILICGTASEGKSTLVRDIHRYFGLPYTEEFGRNYMAEKNMLDTDLTVEDFREFLIGQRSYIKEAESYPANTGITIHDTDNLITLMYAKAYVSDPAMSITQDDYDSLYNIAKEFQKGLKWDKIFLIKPHNKFVNDGSRYMAQSSIEERMKNYNILTDLLKDFGLYDKVSELNGTYYENFSAVRDYINSFNSKE